MQLCPRPPQHLARVNQVPGSFLLKCHLCLVCLGGCNGRRRLVPPGVCCSLSDRASSAGEPPLSHPRPQLLGPGGREENPAGPTSRGPSLTPSGGRLEGSTPVTRSPPFDLTTSQAFQMPLHWQYILVSAWILGTAGN